MRVTRRDETSRPRLKAELNLNLLNKQQPAGWLLVEVFVL